MPELLGEILGMGEKRSQALQRIREEQRISKEFVLSACNQMHSSCAKPTKLTASQETGESVTLNATSLCHFLLLKSVLFIAIFILSAFYSTQVPV